MGILGKHVKGRGMTTNEDRRFTIRVRNANAVFADVNEEMQRIRTQRQTLKENM
jgi:hypothetical protein